MGSRCRWGQVAAQASETDSNQDRCYRAGEQVRVDLFICGFPPGVVLEVLEPGRGCLVARGRVRVRLTGHATGYRIGEVITVQCSDAVPLAHVRWRNSRPVIDTRYCWQV